MSFIIITKSEILLPSQTSAVLVYLFELNIYMPQSFCVSNRCDEHQPDKRDPSAVKHRASCSTHQHFNRRQTHESPVRSLILRAVGTVWRQMRTHFSRNYGPTLQRLMVDAGEGCGLIPLLGQSKHTTYSIYDPVP